MIRFILTLLLFLLAFSAGLKAQHKPRVFVYTDINLAGGDPDDRQSLIHLLWYADELDIEAIVPDYWNGRGNEACELVLEAYRADYESYDFSGRGYPEPSEVRDWIASNPQDAEERLLEALRKDPDPLYVLIWGQMTTFKEALFRHPHMAGQVRVLTIGTGRKYGPRDEVAGEDCNVVNWNGKGRNEIYEDPRFDRMWWMENNWTYNGMFEGSEPAWMFEKLSHYGAMGSHIREVTKNHSWAQYFRVGDTPTVLYLIDPDHPVDDPTVSSWAGKFKKPFPDKKPNYYTDDNGDVEWDYENPCATWSHLQAMYSYNKSTLLRERPGMYESLLEKLNKLYAH
jgi:hypothetical protein